MALDATGALNPANFQKIVDRAAAKFSQADHSASPASACNFNTELNNKRTWANCRHQYVLKLDGGPTPTCN